MKIWNNIYIYFCFIIQWVYFFICFYFKYIIEICLYIVWVYVIFVIFINYVCVLQFLWGNLIVCKQVYLVSEVGFD